MAASGAGGGGGAGGAAGADVSLAVEVVPVELTTSLEESMRATAFCTLPDALLVDDAVSLAIDAENPEPLDDDALSGLALMLEAVPLRCVELAVPVPPLEPELPEMATGLEMAVDDAGPVLPVLVADDDAFTAPEFPD